MLSFWWRVTALKGDRAEAAKENGTWGAEGGGVSPKETTYKYSEYGRFSTIFVQ